MLLNVLHKCIFISLVFNLVLAEQPDQDIAENKELKDPNDPNGDQQQPNEDIADNKESKDPNDPNDPNSDKLTSFGEPLPIDISGDAAGLADAEPGFDLTDEEMKKFKIWRNGIIPYYIDEFSFDKVLRDRLRLFFENVNSITGLRLIELPSPVEDNNTRWLFIVNRRGALACEDITSNSFTNEGIQAVVLGYDCINSAKDLASLVLAVAGVPPQHNAPNRDIYIEVNTYNIIREKQDLFKKLDNKEWLFHDTPYDFASAGHYDFFKHSVNGAATSSPKQPIDETLLEKDSFSFVDLWKIRMLYNFIMKKKNNPGDVPNCNKIFVPGVKFQSYQVASEEEIKPRDKPKEYLGGNSNNEEPYNNNSGQNNGNDNGNDNVNNNKSKTEEKNNIDSNDKTNNDLINDNNAQYALKLEKKYNPYALKFEKKIFPNVLKNTELPSAIGKNDRANKDPLALLSDRSD